MVEENIARAEEECSSDQLDAVAKTAGFRAGDKQVYAVKSEESMPKELDFRTARRNSLLEVNREAIRQKRRRSSFSEGSVPSASYLDGIQEEALRGSSKRKRRSSLIARSIAIGYGCVGSDFEDSNYRNDERSISSKGKNEEDACCHHQSNQKLARDRAVRRCSVTKFSLEAAKKAKEFLGQYHDK